MTRETIYKIIGAVCTCIMAIAAAVLMQSCNVTRTITTESQAYQRGDTSVHIVSRTTEVYDARKH